METVATGRRGRVPVTVCVLLLELMLVLRADMRDRLRVVESTKPVPAKGGLIQWPAEDVTPPPAAFGDGWMVLEGWPASGGGEQRGDEEREEREVRGGGANRREVGQDVSSGESSKTVAQLVNVGETPTATKRGRSAAK